MKVLFLSPDFVLPAKSGLRVRVLSQLRLLSSIDRVKSITVLSLSDSEVSSDRLRELESSVPKLRVEMPARRPLSIRQDLQTFARFAYQRLIRKQPYLFAVHDSPGLHELVEKLTRTESYDVIYVAYLGMMVYLPAIIQRLPSAFVILEQHNLEWQIFDRLANELPLPKLLLVKMEASLLRKRERMALASAKSVVAISKEDSAQFAELAKVSATVVPPFVELKPARVEPDLPPRLAYIGHLGWQPNVLGLDWFCEEVWPLIVAQQPDAQLTIAGPGLQMDASGKPIVPEKWRVPQATTVGFVKDLETLYDATKVMVAPVKGGSGVRMKLLETMSAGMPTVTTPDGAAGLPISDGNEVLIGDSPAQFAEATVRLLRDKELRQRLREGGYRYLSSNHSLAATKQQMDQLLPR